MNKKTAISYMCPACNDFSVFNINIFDFSGSRKKVYKCKCQDSEITVVKNSTKSFKIEFECPVCNEKHSYVVPQNQFWSDDAFTFSCPFYEANILYVGNREKLEERVQDYIKYEFNVGETPSFLPDYSTIEKLIELTKTVEERPESIKICNCESTYSVAYNDKGLYVICDSCGYSLAVSYDRVDMLLDDINCK